MKFSEFGFLQCLSAPLAWKKKLQKHLDNLDKQ